MAPPSLVDSVTGLSKALREIARLLPDEDPLDPPGGKKNAASFLFEIHVVVAMLRGLQDRGWTVRMLPEASSMRLARAPAPKSRASYFHISRDDHEFHVTHGTQVHDRHGEPRAPDISLQRECSGENPTFEHVLAIWDAKLRGSTGRPDHRRISDAEFRSFAMLRDWLDPPRPGDDPLSDWPPAFTVCALITNGRRPSEPTSVMLEARVSIVEHFQDKDTAATPTRDEHVCAATARHATTWNRKPA